MKRVITLVSAMVLAMVFLSTVSVFADDMKLKSVASIVKEIKMDQKVEMVSEINLEKVSPAMLEELGDSVMEATLGDTMMHDKMDISLGGDGSKSLSAYHERIGYNYLSKYPNGILDLISAPKQGVVVPPQNIAPDKKEYGPGYGPGYGPEYGPGYGPERIGMMGIPRGSGVMIMVFIGILGLVFWVLIIMLIVKIALKRKMSKVAPEDILKGRLAKGEITVEEFEKLKALL